MNNLSNKIFIAVFLAILVFLTWFFSDILAYVLIAAVIWFILTPLVNVLDYTSIKGRSLPRWLATVLSLLIFGTLLTAIGMFFIPRAVDQASAITNLNVNKVAENFGAEVKWLKSALVKYKISENPEADIAEYLKTKIVGFFGQIGNVFGYIFSLTGNFIVGIFAVCFITFFFLKDESLVKRIIMGATPDVHVEKVKRVLSNAKRLLSRYFIGLIIQVSLISALVTIGLTFLGVQNALLIGLFAGLINVVPYIGPMIGTAFGLFVVFTAQLQLGVDLPIMPLLLKVLLVFVVIQTLDNIVFQPIIFSNSVNAHPLEIFLIIFVAGKLGGIVGMICAIPGYTLFRIIAKEFFTQFKIVQNLTKNI